MWAKRTFKIQGNSRFQFISLFPQLYHSDVIKKQYSECDEGCETIIASFQQRSIWLEIQGGMAKWIVLCYSCQEKAQTKLLGKSPRETFSVLFQ